jgi:hypothetical protein
MEAIYSSETSVDFERNTQRYIPEDSTLHNHRCEDLKSYIVFILLLSSKTLYVVFLDTHLVVLHFFNDRVLLFILTLDIQSFNRLNSLPFYTVHCSDFAKVLLQKQDESHN